MKASRSLTFLIGFLVFLSCNWTTVIAYAVEKDPPQTPLKLALYIALANRSDNGRGADLVNGLVSIGYDDNHPCGMFGCPDHLPSGGTRYVASYLAIGYQQDPRFEWRFSRQAGSYFDGAGYNSSTGIDLNVEASLSSYALEGWYCLTPALRIGAGPTLSRLKASESSNLSNSSSSETKIGLFIGASVVAPVRSLLFWHFSVRRQFTGSMNIGPYGLLPETPISISHTVWLVIGAGLRLPT